VRDPPSHQVLHGCASAVLRSHRYVALSMRRVWRVTATTASAEFVWRLARRNERCLGPQGVSRNAKEEGGEMGYGRSERTEPRGGFPPICVGRFVWALNMVHKGLETSSKKCVYPSFKET